MANKRLLNELTTEELKTLYNSNSYIQESMQEHASDDANYFYSNEIESYFRHYDDVAKKRDFLSFSLDSDNFNRVFLNVDTDKYKMFLNDTLCFYSDGIGAYSENAETVKATATRLLTLVDKYIDFSYGYYGYYGTITDANFDRFESFFESKIESITDDIERIINTEYDGYFDDDYLFSCFEDAVYNCGYFDDMTTDGRNVYFEVCRG